MSVASKEAGRATALNAEIVGIVVEQQELRRQIDAIMVDLEGAN